MYFILSITGLCHCVYALTRNKDVLFFLTAHLNTNNSSCIVVGTANSPIEIDTVLKTYHLRLPENKAQLIKLG